MRVAHIFKATGLSGAERHLLALAGALRGEGFESQLIVLADQRRLPRALIEAAQARGVPLDIVLIAHDLDLTVVGKIAALLKSAQAQIVHTHMIHGDLYGTLAAMRCGTAVVQSRHNGDKFRRLWIVRLLTRWLAAQAKTVIAISDSLAAFVRDVEGVPASKIVRIHYGLDPLEVTAKARRGAVRAELGLSAETPLLGAVGRLTEQKGFRFLIDAFGRMKQSVADAHLIIAGDGELRSALEAQASASGFADSIHFLGWRNDVPSLMADLDVLAMPSLWEGFGLVTLEAMALSKPIVASRVSALPEIIIHDETGFLVPPAVPSALADAITALLRDPARASLMGKRGHERLEKEFTVEQMARRHAEVYQRIAHV